MRSLFATAFLFLAGSVHALQVQWTVDNAEFIDIGANPYSVTGTFTYDADTLAVSNVSISTQSSNYFFGTDVSGNGSQFVFSNSDDSPSHWSRLVLEFESPLNNAGGAVNLVYGTPGLSLDLLENGSVECAGTICSTVIAAADGGSITGSVVPIPAAAWLFGSALAGLGWIRRKRVA